MTNAPTSPACTVTLAVSVAEVIVPFPAIDQFDAVRIGVVRDQV